MQFSFGYTAYRSKIRSHCYVPDIVEATEHAQFTYLANTGKQNKTKPSVHLLHDGIKIMKSHPIIGQHFRIFQTTDYRLVILVYKYDHLKACRLIGTVNQILETLGNRQRVLVKTQHPLILDQHKIQR